MEAIEQKLSNLTKLRQRLEDSELRGARTLITNLHPSELARFLESLPLEERAVVWEMVDLEFEGDVLVEVSEEVRDGLIESHANRGGGSRTRGYGGR